MNKIHERQEKMIEQESRALEELDTFDSEDPPVSLAMMSDVDFSLGDFLSSEEGRFEFLSSLSPSGPLGTGDPGGNVQSVL